MHFSFLLLTHLAEFSVEMLLIYVGIFVHLCLIPPSVVSEYPVVLLYTVSKSLTFQHLPIVVFEEKVNDGVQIFVLQIMEVPYSFDFHDHFIGVFGDGLGDNWVDIEHVLLDSLPQLYRVKLPLRLKSDCLLSAKNLKYSFSPMYVQNLTWYSWSDSRNYERGVLFFRFIILVFSCSPLMRALWTGSKSISKSSP